MRMRDNLANLVDEEVLERVRISSKYDIVVKRSLIQSLDAVALILQHEGVDRFSLRVPVRCLDELADAIRRVSKLLASEGE